jgi:maleate cis-trans isomerase
MPISDFGAPVARWSHVTGFVTTPACFDPGPQMFQRVVPNTVGVQERVLYVDGYQYQLEQRTRNFGLLEEAAIALARCDCQVVGQVGSNWSHCDDKSPDDTRRLADGISEACGVPFLMAGLSIVEALTEIGAETVTIANGYYRDDWMAGINRFIAQAGFKVLASGNLVDQGIRASLDEMLEVEAKTHWDYPARDVVQSCHKAHLAAPEADVVVQTGAGFSVVPYIEAIEGLVEKPVIPSDAALYWNMMRHAGIKGPHREYGYLLSRLS